VEEQLPAGLCEIAEFVKDDEVHAGETIGDARLATGARFGFETVDEIDGGEEAGSGAGANATACDGDRQVSLAGPGSPYEHGVTLLSDESAAGEISNESLVDRRALELEVVDVLGQWQLADGELVLDRERLLFGDLGVQKVTNEALGFVLTLRRDGERPVVGGLNAVEL
jgi:hypothetical protein